MAVRSLVAVVVLVGVASAVKIDMCRTKPPVMKDFNLLKLEGQWYEYSRLPNIFEYFNKQKCGKVDMTVVKDGMQLDVSFINETTGKEVNYEGKMTTNPEKPGKVLVDLPILGQDYFTVVDAQYKDFVVFYYCDTLWYFKIELSWVLTRSPILSEPKKRRLIEKLKSLKIDTDRLEFEDQENC